MKYLFRTLIACLLTTNLLFAQSNSFFIGGNLGVNSSKFKHSVDLAELYPTSTGILGLNGGLVAGFQFNKVTVSTGLQYVQKGGHYETENFVDQVGTGFFSADEKLHFVSIPVLLGYRQPITDRFGVSVALGPSFNIGLGGKVDETIEYYGSEDVSTEKYTFKFGTGVNDDYRKTQVGFQFSPGLYFKVNRRSQVTMNITWDNGLNDIYNERYKEANTFFDDFKGNQFTRSTMITIGYEYHLSFADKY